MKSVFVALAISMVSSLELEIDSSLSAEAQALASAAAVNDYILAQVERMNAEADAEEVQLAQMHSSSWIGSFFGLF